VRVTDQPQPVWRDPALARPPVPVGTGTGAYVEQPEPRANPMTVEGEIAAFGEMARGAVKRGGKQGVLARVCIGAMLAGMLVSMVITAMRAFT
jgi:hypothetical protein